MLISHISCSGKYSFEYFADFYWAGLLTIVFRALFIEPLPYALEVFSPILWLSIHSLNTY